MTVSQILSIFLCCCSLFCPCLTCDENSKFSFNSQISELNETVPSIFLCRMCGLSQDDEGSFLETASPFSLNVRNETIVLEKNATKVVTTVSVQKLRNPAGNVFDVVTLRKSSCKGVGKWVSDSTWFPGFSWKPCICSQCGRHLGWMFEAELSAKGSLPSKPSQAGFYALIRDAILTESVAQTLTYVPKIFRK